MKKKKKGWKWPHFVKNWHFLQCIWKIILPKLFHQFFICGMFWLLLYGNLGCTTNIWMFFLRWESRIWLDVFKILYFVSIVSIVSIVSLYENSWFLSVFVYICNKIYFIKEVNLKFSHISFLFHLKFSIVHIFLNFYHFD